MRATLQTYLEAWAGADPQRVDIAATVSQLAAAMVRLARQIALGSLAGSPASLTGSNSDGDAQTALDLGADALFLAAAQAAPVAAYASEERPQPVALRDGAALLVAVDPLDGSSNIETNVPLGTIFSLLPAGEGRDFLQPGTGQLAAGFAVYGPQTVLVLTVRDGTQIFTLDPRGEGSFVLTKGPVAIPAGRCEYAINASNQRHWDEPVRAFIDDCMAGSEGPCGADFNMRWLASLVAEAYRILGRGGVFLYPRDARPGYQAGRLRLVYEANPVALVIEDAQGAATDGTARILELTPSALHQRVPLVFGCPQAVERVAAYHKRGIRPAGGEQPSPLFGRRGLFRA